MSGPIDPQLLGILRNVDMNSTADQAIAINFSPFSKYRIWKIQPCNPSVPITLAAGGIYTAPAKGGTAVVLPVQSYAKLTIPNTFDDCALASSVLNTFFNASTLYVSLTLAQGSPATADFYVYGWPIP